MRVGTPDFFTTAVNWLLERTVGLGISSFSDLVFVDDVTLFAELLELLVPAPDTMASEAASLGLEVNWQKTKAQAWAAARMKYQQSQFKGRRWQWLKNLSMLAPLST